MLTELEDLQSSDESVWRSAVSFDIETRSTDGTEIIHKVYTFAHSETFDKWMFREFEEKRSPDTARMSERDWRKSRHVFWNDREAPDIDVPPEVSRKLADLTNSESVTVQVPAGSVTEPKYEEFTYERN